MPKCRTRSFLLSTRSIQHAFARVGSRTATIANRCPCQKHLCNSNSALDFSFSAYWSRTQDN